MASLKDCLEVQAFALWAPAGVAVPSQFVGVAGGVALLFVGAGRIAGAARVRRFALFLGLPVWLSRGPGVCVLLVGASVPRWASWIARRPGLSWPFPGVGR